MVQGQSSQHRIAEHHKFHGWLLLTSEDESAVDVVLYTSQMIDLVDVFILVDVDVFILVHQPWMLYFIPPR